MKKHDDDNDDDNYDSDIDDMHNNDEMLGIRTRVSCRFLVFLERRIWALPCRGCLGVRIVSSVPLVCHFCDTPPGVPFSRHSTYTNEHLVAAP
jgi:hypothetical protein